MRHPQRIVSLSPSNTEILALLGLLDRVVGVTDVCDYPPEVKNKTRIGGYSAISIEKVAAPSRILLSHRTLRPGRPWAGSGTSACRSWSSRPGTSIT